MTNLDSVLKSKDINLPANIHIVKDMESSQEWVWELDHKEGWAMKNCGAGEDSWESPGEQEDQTSQS